MLESAFRAHPVPSRLTPYVRRVLCIQRRQSAPLRLPPSACVHLVCAVDASQPNRRRRVAVQLCRPTRGLSLPAHRNIFMVEFTPTGFFRLLGRPLGDSSRDVPDPSAPLARGVECASVRSHLAESQLPISSTALAAKVERAVQVLEDNGGMMRIADLAASLGKSPRQLNRSFAMVVGISPKTFAQICRIRRAIELLAEPKHDLLTIALECGFFDQAHFIKEMRRFLGAVPRDYRRLAIAGPASA
jgi:AraC-like DNA-binding protein